MEEDWKAEVRGEEEEGGVDWVWEMGARGEMGGELAKARARGSSSSVTASSGDRLTTLILAVSREEGTRACG